MRRRIKIVVVVPKESDKVRQRNIKYKSEMKPEARQSKPSQAICNARQSRKTISDVITILQYAKSDTKPIFAKINNLILL